MAFSPRSKTTFGLPPKKMLPTVTSLELHSFVRQAPCEERDKPPNTAQHRLWLDITRLDTTTLNNIDDKYNSNMWKNFKFVRSKHSANEGEQTQLRTSAEMIAELYPLQAPKSSSVGENTYHKFLQEVKFPERKQNTAAWQKLGKQELQSRRLKIRSECRAPPLDWEGRIVPPTNFKRYTRPLPSVFSEHWDVCFSSFPDAQQMYSPHYSSPYPCLGTPSRYGLRVRGPYIQ